VEDDGVALERRDIEKTDFPIGRRGYDPDAVDRHLSRVAGEVEALRAEAAEAAQRASASLANASSQQVRAIIDAAETTAAGITRDAQAAAERTRADAAAQAREHVARVAEASKDMLQRLDAMEGELGALVETLRAGANRLVADLDLLHDDMSELRRAGAGSDEAAVVEEALAEDAAGEAGAGVERRPEPVEEKEPTVEEKEPTVEEKEPTVEEKKAPAGEKEAPAGEPDDDRADSEGARLIALNMALNGTPRDETDRYLAENFDLPDRAALLDEVYARVG
jgi:DivIVA domain-containing protein